MTSNLLPRKTKTLFSGDQLFKEDSRPQFERVCHLGSKQEVTNFVVASKKGRRSIVPYPFTLFFFLFTSGSRRWKKVRKILRRYHRPFGKK